LDKGGGGGGNTSAETDSPLLFTEDPPSPPRPQPPPPPPPSSEDYLNVTKELPIEYAQAMYGYAMPALLAVTVVANTLIVVVLSKRHMRTPTNALLMAMALCDMLTLLFPAPWLFYMYTFGNHWRPLFPVAACYAWHLMHEVIPALFHTASVWLTLALAAQRYICVCHAATARSWCTMTTARRGVVAIAAAAALHQSTRFMDRQYEPMDINWNGHKTQVCRVRPAAWVDQVFTADAYFMAYFAFRVLFVHAIPCAALVVLNVLLFRAMRAAQVKRRKLFQENKRNECRRLRDSNCTTLMLIVVVTAFLAVEIPLAVVTLLHIISSTVSEILDYSVANVLILFTNFFIILSYPINFAIYCGMSRQFRETFKELFVSKQHGHAALPQPTGDGGGADCGGTGAPSTATALGARRSRTLSVPNGPPRTCTDQTVL
ncbi:sex peptide receptor, partial [Hetaerina americana]|uniref:sex peptide receptor n=1 Tax=Hetaerina americana TaxID=62018 RepID=UPI003A7F2166